MHADLLRGHLDRLLLAVLADAPGHGYELSRRLALRSGGELDVQEGSLYPALHRLERGGLVESSWSTSDGRRRRIYTLTPSGRRAVTESRREWRAFSAVVDRVLGGAAPSRTASASSSSPRTAIACPPSAMTSRART